MKEDWVIIMASPVDSHVLSLRCLLQKNGIESFLMRTKWPQRKFSLYIPKTKASNATQLMG